VAYGGAALVVVALLGPEIEVVVEFGEVASLWHEFVEVSSLTAAALFAHQFVEGQEVALFGEEAFPVVVVAFPEDHDVRVDLAYDEVQMVQVHCVVDHGLDLPSSERCASLAAEVEAVALLVWPCCLPCMVEWSCREFPELVTEHERAEGFLSAPDVHDLAVFPLTSSSQLQFRADVAQAAVTVFA